MNRRAGQAAEIASLAAAVALAALLLAPGGRRAPAETRAKPEEASAHPAVAPVASPPEPARPEEVAALFGWRPPEPAREAAPPVPPRPAAAPRPADWLAYLGYVSDAGGERFLYKDRRTSRVVSVSAADPLWRLVEARAGELIVEHEGSLYSLKRGK